MQHRIETLSSKKLIGKYMQMSLANNKTGELWASFMSARKTIQNNSSQNLYSMQLYPALYFENFNPTTEFTKWATIEVTDFNTIPKGMESIVLPGGVYAVFNYKGNSNRAAAAFQYIFGTWLPSSNYTLDNRPHFELLTETYKNEHPDSEEEIWIPVKK
jgi:AraC family transcriptional regulator